MTTGAPTPNMPKGPLFFRYATGRGYKLSEQHVSPFSHCSLWLCYTAPDLALAHKK